MTSLAYTSAQDRPETASRAVAYWLLLCAFMVFAMAVIGAITRLTESGLSMVEWQPLIGAVPPLGDAEWQRVFDLYRQTPEYRLKNAGMELAAFKEIFFWEWLHRLWGRLIGLVFAVPFVYFWLRGRIGRRQLPGLVGLLLLGGLQGALGWYMVMSGLVDRPSVSHYRLAAHLGMAFLIYGLLLWLALGQLRPQPRAGAAQRLRPHAWAALAIVAVTAFWGALVAGLDAGLAYNSFPLMDGQLLPPEAWSLDPAWANLFENTALVQFAHRWLAVTAGLVVLALWWRVRRAAAGDMAGRVAAAVAGMVLLQVLLGVSTLVLMVPIPLAAAHQAGALLLFGLLIWLVHELKADNRA